MSSTFPQVKSYLPAVRTVDTSIVALTRTAARDTVSLVVALLASRGSSSGGGAGHQEIMALSSVNGALSSLRTCRQDIETGMDVITDVAMDLVEAGELVDRIKEMENMIMDCASLDREMECFLAAVEQVTTEASTPETVVDLSARVKEQFTEKMAQFSDADLQDHPKVVAFKDSIRNCDKGSQLEQSMVDLDEDIAVSQKVVCNVCPLTKTEMVKPMKNKKCNHCYDEQAILALIARQHSQRKKCRCPVVGCGNSNVKVADLVPYALPRNSQRRTQSK